jgi:hypothetical protein
VTPAERLNRLERAVLAPAAGADQRRLAEARERLIAEVDRLAEAQGVVDPGAILGMPDCALEQVAAARRRARSRP